MSSCQCVTLFKVTKHFWKLIVCKALINTKCIIFSNLILAFKFSYKCYLISKNANQWFTSLIFSTCQPNLLILEIMAERNITHVLVQLTPLFSGAGNPKTSYVSQNFRNFVLLYLRKPVVYLNRSSSNLQDLFPKPDGYFEKIFANTCLCFLFKADTSKTTHRKYL